MGGSMNKVILIGNLGADPEIRTAGDGIVAQLRLATNERYTKRDGTEVDETEWHTLVLWRQLAELAERHLCKGRKICVEGKLKTRRWTDQKTGEEKYRTEVIVRELTFLDSKGQAPDQPYRGQGPPGTRAGLSDGRPPRSSTVTRTDGPVEVAGSGATGAADQWQDSDVPF
jgi:single-strand DNA-binding protein